jgi:hypothetical protein
MISRKRFLPVALLITALIASAIFTASYIKRAALGYVYGYPLVIMELTRRAFAQSALVAGSASNNFNHSQIFPDHTFRNVVRANNDTLYSAAWLDLTQEPMVLSVPDTHGRYYVMPFMDAWTNVFASVGHRTHGAKAGEYILAGPGWQGEVPEGVSKIEAPTNMVWTIGRIQTNGKADMANVIALQQGFSFTPLNSYLQGERQAGVAITSMPAKTDHDPYSELESLSGAAYFSLLSTLMSQQPPSADDAEILASLEGLGVSADSPRSVDQFNLFERYLLQVAVDLTHSKIKQELAKGQPLENGWGILRDTIGDYGTNYAIRAGVAMIGLGALTPAEAVYPNTRYDSQMRLLSGENRYRIHFEANEIPPVDAFWSLTMYDEKGFMIENAINRYNIGDRDPLVYNTDGSLDIIIQHEMPKAGRANWLPAAEKIFELTLRTYAPKAPILNGDWPLPVVERF